jgi:hypothetical protein
MIYFHRSATSADRKDRTLGGSEGVATEGALQLQNAGLIDYKDTRIRVREPFGNPLRHHVVVFLRNEYMTLRSLAHGREGVHGALIVV